ncbi:retropepsin-like aspartic protease [Aspergillus lucknowensis]|uniref:Uncharacterized protein n=1 Tax=Aspergillus lucknowensis TaxID=176173 RepID=A0ABR4LF53_9EURO
MTQNMRSGVPPICPKPARRPVFVTHFKMYPQIIRRALSKLCPSVLSQRFGNRPRPSSRGHQATVEIHHERRLISSGRARGSFGRQLSSSSNITQLVPSSQLPTTREGSQGSGSIQTLVDIIPLGTSLTQATDVTDLRLGETELSHLQGLPVDINSPLDIVVRRRGDSHRGNKLVVASIDTGCDGINLMNMECWELLNEDEPRPLEPVQGLYVQPLGSNRIQVEGVVRAVEWHLRNGSRTYTDDFYIIRMERFDVLLGSDTISKHKLVEPGPDLRKHLTRTRQREEAARQREVARRQGFEQQELAL